MVPYKDRLGKTLGQIAQVRVPGRAKSQTDNQPQLGGLLEELQTLLGLKPLVIVREILRIALELVFFRRLGQAIRRTRRVIGIRPRAIYIGKLNQPLGIFFYALRDIVVVVLVVLEARADDHGFIDPILVHLPQ